MTVKVAWQLVQLPAWSQTVTRMPWEPGPTGVPAGGVWVITSRFFGVQSSPAQTNGTKLGICALQLVTVSDGRQWQSTTGGASRRVTDCEQARLLLWQSVASQVRVMTRGVVLLVTVLRMVTVT